MNKFTAADQWGYMHTSNMMAYTGIRQGAQLENADYNSFWINGLPWMAMKTEDFPMRTVMEISSNSEELDHIKH